MPIGRWRGGRPPARSCCSLDPTRLVEAHTPEPSVVADLVAIDQARRQSLVGAAGGSGTGVSLPTIHCRRQSLLLSRPSTCRGRLWEAGPFHRPHRSLREPPATRLGPPFLGSDHGAQGCGAVGDRAAMSGSISNPVASSVCSPRASGWRGSVMPGFKRGAAWLAARTGAPLVAVAVTGSDRVLGIDNKLPQRTDQGDRRPHALSNRHRPHRDRRPDPSLGGMGGRPAFSERIGDSVS